MDGYKKMAILQSDQLIGCFSNNPSQSKFDQQLPKLTHIDWLKLWKTNAQIRAQMFAWNGINNIVPFRAIIG